MQTNALPRYDDSVNTTGCCPKFNPDGWNDQELHFDRKKFARAITRSALHMPLNMGSVFARVQGKIEASRASDPTDVIVLSRELSPWSAEHLFSVSKDLDGEEMTTLSGDYATRVFEGPYRKVMGWRSELEDSVRAAGKEPVRTYFFYTTCPQCAKAYGKNYVVGVTEFREHAGTGAAPASGARSA